MSLLTWLRDRFGRGRPRPTADYPDPPAVLAQWLNGEGVPEPPADAEPRVAALEARYGIRIPEDFRRYLIEVAASIGEAMSDDDLMTWHGLAGVRSLPEELAAISNEPPPPKPSDNPAIAAEEGSYLFFADYMIWCWGWAVCCSDGPNRGRVAFISDCDGFVADSFTAFVQAYVRDPSGTSEMLPPGSR